MNIDKDIETLKKRETMSLNQIIRTFKREGIENFAVVKLESLDNVLSELKTYKKIAEKLADELRLTVNINKVCGTLDVENKRCNKEDISCKQCTIDWARKEVANEQNNNT